MKEIERTIMVLFPLLLSLVLIFLGAFVTYKKPDTLHGIIIICTGLICSCFYPVCSLVAKLIEK